MSLRDPIKRLGVGQPLGIATPAGFTVDVILSQEEAEALAAVVEAARAVGVYPVHPRDEDALPRALAALDALKEEEETT